VTVTALPATVTAEAAETDGGGGGEATGVGDTAGAGGVAQAGVVIALAWRVTAPVSARALPSRLAVVVIEIESAAMIVPTN
jgi:hypothetical protein